MIDLLEGIAASCLCGLGECICLAVNGVAFLGEVAMITAEGIATDLAADLAEELLLPETFSVTSFFEEPGGKRNES